MRRLLLLMILPLTACESTPRNEAATQPTTQPSTQPTTQPAANPAAPGFNAEASDPDAIAVADELMQALGGRDAWDATRYVRWTFFGRRTHTWDRHTGDARIEGTEKQSGEPFVICMNVNSKQGRVWIGGEEVTDFEKLKQMLRVGYQAWVNDSYWLFMPFKLKDSGVTLKYLGERGMASGESADVLELTFDDVGVTPQNKYHVFVDKDSRLVRQWSFFANASDEEPAITTPWDDWRRYGEIMLSGDRGSLMGMEARITNIAVMEDVEGWVFEKLGEETERRRDGET
jgi:hypothetical protein